MKDPDSVANADKAKILITGGSGLIGRHLTSLLLEKGYSVSHLSRKANLFGKVRVYRWNPSEKILNPEIIEGVDYIVHLAGANLGEKRWTKKRREELISSRVESANFLHDILIKNNIKIKGFISASAVGYYGTKASETVFTEDYPAAKDFTGNLCKQWEAAADLFCQSGIRTVKIRTAVVLEKNDGLLKKLLPLARWGIFPVLGNGKQYIPWIHIRDLCLIYLKAIEDSNIKGAYNACAPGYLTQESFMQALASVMGKKGFFPHVPSFVLKTALGSMSAILLEGSRVSSSKIISAGFDFNFKSVSDALKDILGS